MAFHEGIWLLAAWPGMGSVAVSAATHLVQYLEGEVIEELPTQEWFPVRSVDVRQGMIQESKPPRLLLLRCQAPEANGLLVCIGESQPENHGHALCHTVIKRALAHGARHCATCAAMAGPVDPRADPVVHIAATDARQLESARRAGGQALLDGQIGGLNGVILATAEQAGMDGICLLGDMPFFATGIPNPKASLACLQVFTRMSGIAVDLEPLRQQAESVESSLLELLERLRERNQEVLEENFSDETDEAVEDLETSEELTVDPQLKRRIEGLFLAAEYDRRKAFELKEVLDQNDIFGLYEDRFLDLFRRTE
ncbi:MAG: PAC2 family protein [Planctomycetota bacterium]